MMLEYVNAKIGSLNERRFSNGNIYPVTARPFGTANFTVQTDGSSNWFYSPLSHATPPCSRGCTRTGGSEKRR